MNFSFIPETNENFVQILENGEEIYIFTPDFLDKQKVQSWLKNFGEFQFKNGFYIMNKFPEYKWKLYYQYYYSIE